MKLLIALLLIGSQAQAYQCPSYLDNNKKAQTAHQWLSQFKGTMELHGCFIEITSCETEGEKDESAPVGEVFLQTEDGREAYVSLDFPTKKDRRFKTKVKANKRTLYFRKKDRYYEEVNGRTEVWRFEMRTLWDDQSVLDVVQLGTYSTNNQLNQSNGNDSRWFNCKPEGVK